MTYRLDVLINLAMLAKLCLTQIATPPKGRPNKQSLLTASLIAELEAKQVMSQATVFNLSRSKGASQCSCINKMSWTQDKEFKKFYPD